MSYNDVFEVGSFSCSMEYLTELHRFVIASLILSECNWSVCVHLEWEGDQQQQKNCVKYGGWWMDHLITGT